MSVFSIYGLRLAGELEARYIGQTSHPLTWRLAGHFAHAKAMPLPTQFATWLVSNSKTIEPFLIHTVATREEARIEERRAIEFCLALNHRLFNQWLVPAEQRMPARLAA